MIGIVIFIFTDFVYDISFMHWVVLGRRGLGFTSDFILHYLKILFPFFFFFFFFSHTIAPPTA